MFVVDVNENGKNVYMFVVDVNEKCQNVYMLWPNLIIKSL